MTDKASYFGLLFGSQKEGFLTKRGALVKNWKRRWFVLKDDVLYVSPGERYSRAFFFFKENKLIFLLGIISRSLLPLIPRVAFF
jgi:hypothetical protein